MSVAMPQYLLHSSRLRLPTYLGVIMTNSSSFSAPRHIRSYYYPSKQAQYSDGTTRSSPSNKKDDAADKNSGTRQSQAPAPPKMLKRDEEVLAKLLDREGGSAGVCTLEGAYEEGLGPQSKKNMFRLI